MQLRFSSDAQSEERVHHVCQSGRCINKLVRWKQERVHAYMEHIQDNDELLAQFEEAEEDNDVDMLAFCIRSLIAQAANSRTAVYLNVPLGGRALCTLCGLMKDARKTLSIFGGSETRGSKACLLLPKKGECTDKLWEKALLH